MDHTELCKKVESLHLRFGLFDLQQVRTRIKRHELASTPEIGAVLEDLESIYARVVEARKRLNSLTFGQIPRE